MSASHTPGYEVMRDGRVFSIKSNWRGYGRRELVHDLNDDGYPSVCITIDGKRTRYAVHVLVAHQHLPARPTPSHQVRHLDGNKLNPHAENLAWGTEKENADDRDQHGRTSRGTKHSIAIKRGLPPEPHNKGKKSQPAHNKGKPISEDQRKKLSLAMTGKPWTKARRNAHAA